MNDFYDEDLELNNIVFTEYKEFYNVTHSSVLSEDDFKNNHYVLVQIQNDSCSDIVPADYKISGNTIVVTAKYEAYVPKLNTGLYGYEEAIGIYDEVTGQELFYDLRQIYNKMLTFKELGYPALIETIPQSVPVVQITNTNENQL